MTFDQNIALGSAVVSLVSMFFSLYFSFEARKASGKSNANESSANTIAVGQSETSLRDQIAKTRGRMEDCGLQVTNLTQGRSLPSLSDSEKGHLEALEATWRSAAESCLNAYEDACGKFLDGKIDKERFKKTYVHEIKNLCDPGTMSFARLMHPESVSKYGAIWKVYGLWHRYE